jgi:hypothetical protein
MVSRDEWRWTAIWAVVLVVVTTLPYLIAYLTTPADLFYTGFLSNPEDGHSYLAKMRQGWRGEWLYRLAFTPEPHEGEFLFTYYLGLGHIARWTRLPLPVAFHVVRAVNGILLLLVLYWAAAQFSADVTQRRFAFLIGALGSGLGWLAMFFGGMTADLWIPEGFVLYSVFVNPHFPLGIALMTLILLWSVTPWDASRIEWPKLVGVALCTVALGVVQPFCLLTVGLVLLIYALVRWAWKRRLPWREIASGLVFGISGAPVAINGYLSTTQNTAFAGWSALNQTPSPPPWDYVIGYGVVLLLATFGLWHAVRRRQGGDLFLIVWVLTTVALLYLPYSLQRRLVMGVIVPLGVLAAIGWQMPPIRQRPKGAAVCAFAALTHVFLIGMSLLMAITGHRSLFMGKDEHDALRWLADEVSPDALVVAAPETGLYIPAWAGQRVYYGHRFETANAEQRQAQLSAFYREGERDLSPPPDYVFYGPRERELQEGDWQPDPNWKVVYQQGTVTIYAVPRE